jgi:UDP-N-acetylglucosamine--N-acetylmuramyl-(pentapeptide) pyrophosphoryl-undecaprenol N-acetylglucosamine transferase
MKKICIACGGSAGHIFPGLTLAEEIRSRYGDDAKVTFFTSDNRLGQSLLKESGFIFYTLPLQNVKERSIYGRIDFVVRLLKSFLKSARIIFLTRPDCFVGFGSYIAGPPFVVALLLKIPTLIHEQNVAMGRANRIMKYFATKIALSFPEINGLKTKSLVITGNPIRNAAAKTYGKIDARKILGLSHERLTMLVIGGSQGSRTINTVATEMLKRIEWRLRNRIQVIHITGEADYERLQHIYSNNIDIPYKIYTFFKDMGIIYSAADISISRAGASVIFELCTHKIPSILIPYPFADSHQVKNASLLVAKGAAIMIQESELSGSSLQSAVIRLIEDKNLRVSISTNMGIFAVPDAVKKLADEVDSLAGLHA